LAAKGWRVFAGARRVEDVPATAGVSSVRLDVTNEPSIAEAVREISRKVGEEGLLALVNSAGIVVSGPLECVTGEELRKQFEVNVLGVAAVTRGVLPLLRKRGECTFGATAKWGTRNSQPRARIVTISSVSGLVAYPFLGAYAASKFATEAMADALRIELSPWGIGVALIEPGPVVTPIWQKALAMAAEQGERWGEAARKLYPVYFEKIPARLAESEKHGAPVEAVAARVERALTARRMKARYPIGPGSTLARLRKFIPDRVWDGLVKRALKKG